MFALRLGIVATFAISLLVATEASAQTVAELQAQIQVLLQQVTALERFLQNSGAVTPVTLLGTATCPTLHRTLRSGVSGNDVSALQQFLAEDRNVYPEALVTGYFGALTEAAVQRWQAKHGVVSSGTPDTTGFGVVGPATRAMIARSCAVPVTAPAPVSPSVAKQSCVAGSGTSSVAIPHGEARLLYREKAVGYGGVCLSAYRACTDGALSGDSVYQFSNCTIATTPASCSIDGVTVLHGQSRTLYRQNSVLFGQQCEPFGQSRMCTNGVFSGNSEYRFATCAVAAANACSVVTLNATSSPTTTVAHGLSRSFYSQDTVAYTQSCESFKQQRLCTDGHLSGTDTHTYPMCTVIPANNCVLDTVAVSHGSKRVFYSARSVSRSVEESCAKIGVERTCTNGVLSGNSTYKYAVCAKVGQRWCLLDGKYVQHNTEGTFYSGETAPFGTTCAQYQLSRKCTDGTLAGNSSYQYASCTVMGARSCTLDEKTIGHGSSAVFYSQQTAPSGDSCAAYGQTRYCTDGFLSGSSNFQYQSCSN